MKKIFSLQAIILVGILFVPVAVFAQTGTSVSSGITSLASIINVFTNTVVKALATLALSLGLLAFFYGLVQYIWGRREGNTEKTKMGNQFISWGLVALFVMFSVYGIIKTFQNIVAPGTDWTTISIPDIQFKAAGSQNLQIGNQAPSSPGFNPQGSSPASSAGFSPQGYTPPASSGYIDPNSNTANPATACNNKANMVWINDECVSTSASSLQADDCNSQSGMTWKDGQCVSISTLLK